MADISQHLAELSVQEPPAAEELRTGLVYDPQMQEHVNEVDPSHPERPERVGKMWQALTEGGLVGRCRRVLSREAGHEELKLVHSESYLELMAETPQFSPERLITISRNYNSIFINQATFPAARLAAGCVVELTQQVVAGKVKNGAAIVRPPGHHAEAGFCMGFCIFNSVAMAAKVAIERLGLQRVLIVDWDVHHGNATQHMFYDDKRVLYFSLHRYDDGFFFPGQPDADHTFTGGAGAGGYNVNVAWNQARMGDSEYLAAFHHILMPIAYEFNPELVIVSCGFDAALGDPIGHYDVTPAGYAHMTHLLMGLAGGRVVLALEGGYNLSSISSSMCACVAALLGDPLPVLELSPPNDRAVSCIRDTARSHVEFWKSLSVIAQEGEPPSPEPSEDSLSGKATPEERHASFGRSAPQQQATPTAVPTTEVSVSHDQDAPPTASGFVRSQVNMTASQELVVQALEEEGNTVMYAVAPQPWCEHLVMVAPLPAHGIDSTQVCETCGEQREPWICLSCHHVYCGRYINQHMVAHSDSSGHRMVLSLADLSVWCFTCDAYVDNPVVHPAKNALHRSKFGTNMDGSS